MKFKNNCVIAGCASTAFLFGSMARADVITVTGSYTGAAGAPGPGDYFNGMFYTGNPGGIGYNATDASSSYVFNGVNATGGAGGEVTSGGNYGGFGGPGVSISGPPLATINSGTYTGGVGGLNDSTGNRFAPGDGADARSGSVVVNGGTFTGGAGQVGVYGGGIGFFDGGGSALTILLGSFAGGPGDVNLGNGWALYILGSADIYGGTFTSSSNNAALYDASSGPMNIYGSNFAINGVPVGYGAVAAGSGTLTGLLQDNSSPTSITYLGPINLVAVIPEPASVGLIIGGMVVTLGRRRRRSARLD